ncbi:OmpA family protein [bacterium]|nr:OmpA family protein [bacterium]
MKTRFINSCSLAFILALLFACAGSTPIGKDEPIAKIQLRTLDVPSFRWDAYSFINLDISHFPDSVAFFLPIGPEPCSISDAILIEDVFGWEEDCNFSYHEFGVPYGSNIVVVEDISASMGDYLPFTDKLIWGFASTLIESGGEISFVRFGESAEITTRWLLPDSFLNLSPEELPYPNKRGSDLAGALELALNLVSERQNSKCAIVLFSDGDFPVEEIPVTLIERTKRYGVSINILMHGKNPPGALSQIAKETDGIYFVQPEVGFSSQLVSAIIAQCFFIVYYPKYRAEDGALHRVNISFGDDSRYRGEFRAPGQIPDVEFDKIVETPEFIIPDELLRTTIIPFDTAGNHNLLTNSREILDNYLTQIGSLPDSLYFALKISGYACNMGPTGINIRLSKQRAEVVYDYLLARITENFKLQIAWHGELYPLNENRDEIERRANRRVELNIDRK